MKEKSKAYIAITGMALVIVAIIIVSGISLTGAAYKAGYSSTWSIFFAPKQLSGGGNPLGGGGNPLGGGGNPLGGGGNPLSARATFGPAQTVGIKMSNPQMRSGGMSITYNLELGADITSGLSSKSKQLDVSNQISSTVSQGYSLATDGLKALLGIPGIPSAVDVLAGLTDWLNKNAPPCLRQIGTKYSGRVFKGTYTYDVKKGKGSAIYKDWDYFYATETFRAPDGFSCTQGPTCVFSAKKEMANGVSRGYTGELSKSCFG